MKPGYRRQGHTFVLSSNPLNHMSRRSSAPPERQSCCFVLTFGCVLGLRSGRVPYKAGGPDGWSYKSARAVTGEECVSIAKACAHSLSRAASQV